MDADFHTINTKKFDVLFFFFLCCTIIVLFVIFFQDAANWSYQADQFMRLVKYGFNPSTTPNWQIKKYSFRGIGKINDTVVVTAVEYRSKWNAAMYGIEPVNADRTRKFGLTRRLRRYKRKQVIYVPEIAQNAVRCDSWINETKDNEKDELSDNNTALALNECVVSHGDAACFNCIESRRFLRLCIHMPHALTVTRKDGSDFTIPPNRSEEYGWCLPSNFTRLTFEDKQPVPRDIERNCNPNTGTWLLSQLGDDNGEFDASYNWICKCRYPNLMTNLTTLMSDCLKPVGCGEHGRLDDNTIKGLVNPYRDGSCLCEHGYTPDWDKATGPLCVPVNIGSTDTLDNLYKKYHISFGQALRRDFISPAFLSLFERNYASVTNVPDPCKVDALTGRETHGCEATQWLINNERVVFCQSKQADHIAIKTSTDYLLNNQGRYPNACAKIYESNQVAMVREGHDIPMNLSFFNGKSQPDVGIIIFGDISSNLRQLYDKLWQTDENLRTWYVREVKATKIWNNKRFYLHHDLNRMADKETIVVYEDHPNAGQDQQTYLHKLLYAPFVADDKQAEQYEKTFILYGQHYNHYFREYYGFRDYWWWDQSLEQYNSRGSWGLVPKGAMYTRYFPQSGDIHKQTYRMSIIHHRFSYNEQINALHAKYPAMPERCNLCSDWGSLSSDYVREWIIPSLYVCLYENPHLPIQINKKYFSFDGTVTLYRTRKTPSGGRNRKLEIFVFAERFVGNFRGYHQKALKL